MKFQRIIDYVEYTDRDTIKYCWRWFAVLARALDMASNLLCLDEICAMQKLLANYQKTIQHASAMKPFIIAIRCVLERQAELETSGELKKCLDANYWHEIMENAKKQAVIDKMQEDNMNLIGVFITHKIFHSHGFIEALIGEITDRNIKKSNTSIQLLINVIRNVNFDLLASARDMKMAIINWLSSKVKTTELRKVIGNDCSMELSLVADLYVLCILSRHCERPIQVNATLRLIDGHNDEEHMATINRLSKYFQYRIMSELIVGDTFDASHSMINERSDMDLPDRNAIEAIIDEAINDELEKSLGLDDSAQSNTHSSDAFYDTATSLATYAHILNSCVLQRSMTRDRFEKSNFKKRIGIKIQQLNSVIGQLSGDRDDVNEMVDKMLQIWHDTYHPVVRDVVFNLSAIESVVTWLEKQLRPIKRRNSPILAPLQDAGQLEFDEQVQLKCLTLMLYIASYATTTDPDNERDIFQTIEDYTFNMDRNEDVFIALEMAKVCSILLANSYTVEIYQAEF